MGSRANIFVVEEGRVRVFYSHWAGQDLHEDLFWGPAHARTFALRQKEVGEAGILDSVWAEGGAVIDIDRRILRLFSRFDSDYDVLLCCAYTRLLGAVWSGWDVAWAARGVLELLDHVGLPGDLAGPQGPESQGTLADAQVNPLTAPEEEWIDSVCSIRFETGDVRIYPEHSGIPYLAAEPDLAIRFAGSVAGLSAYDWPRESPLGAGLHIDQPRRSMLAWSFNAYELPNTVEGWALENAGHGFERQAEATDGRLRFPQQPETERLLELGRSLLRDRTDPRVGADEMLDSLLKRKGGQLELNPLFEAHVPVVLPRGQRERILGEALTETGMADLRRELGV